MLRLRLWVRRSEFRRDRRLKAMSHVNHTLLQTKFIAWKNRSYPLGLRSPWSPSTYHCEKEHDARGTNCAGTHHPALASHQIRCVERAEAERALDSRGWRGSSGSARLALLRLPMIRWRLRRTLFVWRKQTEKETRFRYITGILPQKVKCVWALLGTLAACLVEHTLNDAG